MFQLGGRVFISSGGTIFVGSVTGIPNETSSLYWVLFDKKQNHEYPVVDYPRSYTAEEIKESMDWVTQERPEYLIGTEFEVKSAYPDLTLTGENIHAAFGRTDPIHFKPWPDLSPEAKQKYNDLARELNVELDARMAWTGPFEEEDTVTR